MFRPDPNARPERPAEVPPEAAPVVRAGFTVGCGAVTTPSRAARKLVQVASDPSHRQPLAADLHPDDLVT
jgi:hypothetical protein